MQVTHYTSTVSIGRIYLSGNGRQVVYAAALPNQFYKWYVANTDGAGAPQLINGGIYGTDVGGVSYDGSRIAWRDATTEHVYVNGVDVTPCVSHPSAPYLTQCLRAWGNLWLSGDGRYVFYVSQSPWPCQPIEGPAFDCQNTENWPFVWRVPSGGGDAVQWTSRLPDALDAYNPGISEISPSHDGRLVAFAPIYRKEGVYEYQRLFVSYGGATQTRLNVNVTPYLSDAYLSADGNWIGYHGIVATGVTSPVVVYADGSQETHVRLPGLNWTGGNYDSVRGISQDGSKLLLYTRNDSSYTTWFPWTVKRDGSDLMRVLPSTSLYVMNNPWYTDISYSGNVISFVSDDDVLGNGNASYQVFVVKGAAAADWQVEPFALDPNQTVMSGVAYVLPVKVEVKNTGDLALPAVPLRFTDSGGRMFTQTVPALNPGLTATVQLDWDITTLLAAGQGQQNVQIEAKVDPLTAYVEISKLNNAASASAAVDARPRILDVKPQYSFSPGYFLANQSVPNLIKAWVDWNGALPGNGAPPYGEVRFNLHGAQTTVPGQEWGAEYTYDMGSDFQAAFACANNTLRARAVLIVQGVEFTSLDKTLQPTVFPFPGWVDWLETLGLGSFKTDLKEPLVEYTYGFTYPEDPFETTWTPPAWVPYLGGRKLGINDTQAAADALGRSDGAGSVGVQGQTSMDFAAFTSKGSLYGQGDARFKCGESLDLEQAKLGFKITIGKEFEMGLVDVVPGLRAAEQWPVVGRIIRWVNSLAQVKTSITPGVKVDTVFRDRDDQLKFDSGMGRAEIAAEATLSTEVCEGLGASAFGGGTPYVAVQVPKNPGYLQEVGIDLKYGANFEAWAFEAEYKRMVNCKYPPGDCAQKEEGQQEGGGQVAAASSEAQPAWHLIPRDYARVEHARAPRYALLPQASLAVGAVTTETVLLTNIYRRPEPALAISGTRRLLAYIHDDTSKPLGRGTELRVFTYNGSSWSGPTSLTSDSQPDFGPALAFDASGDGVLAWERSRLATGITPTLDMTFAQSLEIAARSWNGTMWGSVVTLTNNSLMDHAPRLSAGADGTVTALWQTNDGTDILGTPAHPLTLTYAVWNGSAWGVPAAALTGLQDVVNVAFAAYSSTQAALVYARDMDGLLTTTTDLDLFYSAFNGAAWSGPTRLTNDVLTDTTPSLAYDAAGNLHLVWLRNSNLMWLRNSWNVNDAQTVRAASAEGGFLGFRLSRAANGNLALVWQAMQETGANLAYIVYDAAANAWGADQSLMRNTSVEAAHSPAFGADGNLYLAYQKIAVNLVTETIQISPTLTMTVTNLPQRGQSDLAFLAHTVGRDLMFDSLTVAPANPAPGQSITLTAVLRNAGDLSIVSPQVAFYDGATPIVTQTLALTLTAGYTTNVQAVWSLSASAMSHTLRATADPAGPVVETDEANNDITLTTTLPDLAVDRVYATHAPDAITVTARLSNTGALSLSTPFTVALRLADPVTGTLIKSLSVSESVAVGGQITVTMALTQAASLAGLGNQAWLVADAGNAVLEADENNNTDFTALNILPDLTLTAADIGESQVTIRNQGYITATSVTVEARQAAMTGTLVASGTAALIAPGDSVSLTIALAPGSYTLFVKADPNGAIAETDESNNLAVRQAVIWQRVFLPVVLRQ